MELDSAKEPPGPQRDLSEPLELAKHPSDLRFRPVPAVEIGRWNDIAPL